MNEETKLKDKCHKWLKKNKIFHIKLSDKFYSGIPDILVIHKGRALWFELKTEKGVVSEIQKWTHLKLINAGCECFVVRSLDELKEKYEICTSKNRQ